MRIKDELFGKEVLDSEVKIVGKVSDAVFDKETFELTDIVIKKSGFSEQIKGIEKQARIYPVGSGKKAFAFKSKC